MKFKVTMKDPDTLFDAISDAVDGAEFPGLAADEIEAVKEKRIESIQELCSEWFEYSEYLTVEIDTEEKTCVVVKK